MVVEKAFDGNPEWIYNVLDPYLKKTRATETVQYFNEELGRSLLAYMIHRSLLLASGITPPALQSEALLILEAKTSLWGHRADLLFFSEKSWCVLEHKNIKIWDLFEGTFGIKLPRSEDNKHIVLEALLTPDLKLLVARFAHYLREILDERVFRDGKFNPGYPTAPDLSIQRDIQTGLNMPNKLEHFFFWGYAPVPGSNGKKKEWKLRSIFALWEEAEKQADDYVDQLCIPHNPKSDGRYKSVPLPSGETASMHAVIVIVIAGICVLARKSRKQRKPLKFTLVPTGKLPR